MSRVYTIEIRFPGDASSTDVTHLVVDRSVQIKRQLFNADRRSVVDTMSFTLKYDSTIAAKYYAASERILVTAAYEDASAAFTGVIDPVGSQTVTDRVGPMQFEAVDNSYLLDLPLQESFEYPATVGDPPFAILTKSSTATSIVHQILSSQGYTAIVDANCPDITTAVQHVAGTKDEETAREFLDDLLSDYGYTFFFTNAGNFSVYQWDRDTVTASQTISEDFCTSGFTIRKTDQIHDGIRLEWTELDTMAGALLYRENLPISASGGGYSFTGKSIANGDYFPPDSDIEDIYQDFKTRWLDRPYLNRETRLENRDLSLISTSTHSVEFTADSGVAVESSVFEAKRARVRLRNTSGATAKIYTFDIVGTALYRSAIRYVTAPDSAKHPKHVTSRFIFDETSALRSVRARSRIVRFSDFTYEFALREPVSVGDVIQIQQTDPAIDTAVVITAEVEQQHTKVRQYTAEALTEFSADGVLIAGGGQAGPAVQDTVNNAHISNSPTYDDLDNGYTAPSGGTTTPTVPVLGGEGVYRGAILELTSQPNLTNFSHFEIQVSDNGGTNWYQPVQAGTGLGVENEWLEWTSTLFNHVLLPLGGTADAPTGKDYTYRARRVTKLGDKSAWSSTITLTASPVESGTIAADAISANLLKAAVAQVSSQLIIDEVGGQGTVGAEGTNKRVRLTEDGLFNEMWDGSQWDTYTYLDNDGLGFIRGSGYEFTIWANSTDLRISRYNQGVFLENALTINRATGDIEIPGDVTVGSGSGTALQYIDGGVGSNRGFFFQTNGSNRWFIHASGDAESGSNAGTQLNIARYTDAGGYIDTPLQIARATGNVGIGGTGASTDRTLEITSGAQADARVRVKDDTAATASAISIVEFDGTDGRGGFVGLSSGYISLTSDSGAPQVRLRPQSVDALIASTSAVTFGVPILPDNGVEGTWNIGGSLVVIPARGVYQLVLSTLVRVDIFTGGTWRQAPDSFSGAFVTDGSNVRIRNASPSAVLSYYRKF